MSKVKTKHLLRLHRAAADPQGGPEHCSESSPSSLQSPGGGCSAVTASPVSPGPNEAEEQPLFERGAPQRFASAARPAAEPRAQTRHLGRQPVQQHGRGARPAGHLDTPTLPPGRQQEPNATRCGLRGSPQEKALTVF